MAGIVFIGDDFTGASDSLATYARHGLSARLQLAPSQADDGLEVLGLPTDLRSLTPERALAEIDRLWPRIEAAAPRVLHLKTCSTFDSAPHVGSIGAVALELARRFRPEITAVIGGQPSLGRYCAFGTLFARGPDGAVHRIDRHPIMASHPVTPMAEADLRRHLAGQGLDGLELISAPDLPDAATAALQLRAGPVLFDVMKPADQGRIASLLAAAGGRQLLIGPSSVAEILTRDRTARELPEAPPPGTRGVLLFAGSRSSLTSRQIEAAEGYDKLPLPPEALGDPDLPARVAARLATGRPVLLHLLPGADYGQSPDALAETCSQLVAEILARQPVGHLGLAGGDTSSRICARLGLAALEYQRNLAPGVPLCLGRHPDPARDRMRIMLKGGQMGGATLFNDFTALLPA